MSGRSTNGTDSADRTARGGHGVGLHRKPASAERSCAAILIVLLPLTAIGLLLIERAMTPRKGPTVAPTELQCLLFERAIDAYARDHTGRAPTTLEELVVPDARGERYLSSTHVPRDPWKREFR